MKITIILNILALLSCCTSNESSGTVGQGMVTVTSSFASGAAASFASQDRVLWLSSSPTSCLDEDFSLALRIRAEILVFQSLVTVCWPKRGRFSDFYTFNFLFKAVSTQIRVAEHLSYSSSFSHNHEAFPALPATAMLKAKFLSFNMDKLSLKVVQVGREAEDSVLWS